MKKFIIISIIFLAVMSSCSRKGGEEKGKIVLKWSGYAYPVWDKYNANKSKEFEKLHPGVVVKYEPIAGRFMDKILTQIAARVAPDVFYATNTTSFIRRGILLEITEYIKEDRAYFEKVFSPLMEGNTYEGKIYTLPGNCAIDCIYYNKDLFDKEKVPCPDESWTWEDLLDASKKLTKRDSSGNIIQYGCISDQSALLQILQNGGKIWNDDGSKCIINSPQAREAIKFWRDLYAKHWVSPQPRVWKEQMTIGPLQSFIMGKTAIYCGGTFNISNFRIKSGGGMVNWDAALSPRPKEGSERFVGLRYLSLGIWSKTKHPKLAYELAKFMMTPEYIAFRIKLGDSLPIRKEGKGVEAYLNSPGASRKAKDSMLRALRHSKSYYREIMILGVPLMQQADICDRVFDKFNLVSMCTLTEPPKCT